MKWDSVNQWLTLLANIGVLIGLVLLIIEIDQNTDMVVAQVHQSRTASTNELWANRADSEYLAPALLRFQEAGGFQDLSSIDKISAIDAYRVQILLTAFHLEYDDLVLQYEMGFLDEEWYEYRIASGIRAFAPWWRKLDIGENGGRRPGFQAEIERLAGKE